MFHRRKDNRDCRLVARRSCHKWGGGLARVGVFRRRDSSNPLRFAQNDMWGALPSLRMTGGLALEMTFGWRRAVREPPLRGDKMGPAFARTREGGFPYRGEGI